MVLDKNRIKDNCLNEIKNKWLQMPDTFPLFLTEISKETKMQNEQYIQSVSERFKNQIKRFSHITLLRKKRKQKMLNILTDVLSTETIICVHNSMDQQTLDAFQEDLKNFLRHVRAFAPELSLEGIGQAIRNYIVYAMFNVIHQEQPCFSIACFGYSMLYPFTDNYIDSKQYSAKEKLAYNQIIRDKIEGNDVQPQSLYQKKTCELLQAIELEYPRDKNPTIYTLLLMILEAQEDSIKQQNKGFPLMTEEILNISLYKGGVSVLIDRYFVKKKITNEDLNFYLGFGFFLQLADDLQDIKEDSLQGNQTIFTLDLQCKREEKLVNKLLHFMQQIMNSYQAENDTFKDFILSNCYQLIYTSVIRSKEFFSQEYIDHLERYLPITYPFLENMKKNMLVTNDIKMQDHYLKILDELCVKE